MQAVTVSIASNGSKPEVCSGICPQLPRVIAVIDVDPPHIVHSNDGSVDVRLCNTFEAAVVPPDEPVCLPKDCKSVRADQRPVDVNKKKNKRIRVRNNCKSAVEHSSLPQYEPVCLPKDCKSVRADQRPVDVNKKKNKRIRVRNKFKSGVEQQSVPKAEPVYKPVDVPCVKLLNVPEDQPEHGSYKLDH